jgi:hypothetical protein
MSLNNPALLKKKVPLTYGTFFISRCQDNKIGSGITEANFHRDWLTQMVEIKNGNQSLPKMPGSVMVMTPNKRNTDYFFKGFGLREGGKSLNQPSPFLVFIEDFIQLTNTVLKIRIIYQGQPNKCL